MKTLTAPVDPVAVRSANMARIRGTNTRPEIQLRKALWRSGLRYRVALRVEGVRPDLVFIAQKIAVFVDGCFWHGCPDHYVRPRTGTDFWASKLATNVRRDRLQTGKLLEAGWSVLRFWEHEIKRDLAGVVGKVVEAHKSPPSGFGPRKVVIRVEESSDVAGLERWFLEDLLDIKQPAVETRERTLRPSLHQKNCAKRG